MAGICLPLRLCKETVKQSIGLLLVAGGSWWWEQAASGRHLATSRRHPGWISCSSRQADTRSGQVSAAATEHSYGGDKGRIKWCWLILLGWRVGKVVIIGWWPTEAMPAWCPVVVLKWMISGSWLPCTPACRQSPQGRLQCQFPVTLHVPQQGRNWYNAVVVLKWIMTGACLSITIKMLSCLTGKISWCHDLVFFIMEIPVPEKAALKLKWFLDLVPIWNHLFNYMDIYNEDYR